MIGFTPEWVTDLVRNTHLRADRNSVRNQHGLSERQALEQEWRNSKAEVSLGIKGAMQFASGKGRGGNFDSV